MNREESVPARRDSPKSWREKRLLRSIHKGLRDPKSQIKRPLRRIRNWIFVRKVVKEGTVYYKYKRDLYPERLNRGNRAAFIYDTARRYCQGKGLDIGAGRWPMEGAIPIQDLQGQNAYKLDGFENNSLDYIFSSHCLEHLKHWKDALSLWIRKIKTGGILFLYLPHESMRMWRPGGPWVKHHHVWIPTLEAIIPFLRENGMEILDFNPGRDTEWCFHIVARKLQNKD